MNFKEWLYVRKASRSTVVHYSGAVYGHLSEFSKRIGAKVPLHALSSLEDYDEQVERLLDYAPFQELDAAGHRMYRAALKKYRVFLAELLSGELMLSDIREIEASPGLGPTERATVIAARVGQGRYRSGLMDVWDGRCSVTGYPDGRLLLASHIKPWAASNNTERLDPFNGLLLTPNLDRAFDSGLISFDPKERGRILLSPGLVEPAALGISDTLRLRSLPERTAAYLESHVRNVFVKELR